MVYRAWNPAIAGLHLATGSFNLFLKRRGNSMGKLEGNSAVITGGDSGIGRACALNLPAEGTWVTVADIREGIAKETADRVIAAGGTAMFFRSDVGSETDVEAMIFRPSKMF
jgi:NADP-dependent 3-hydroxy acid dehydrogenase YdfG